MSLVSLLARLRSPSACYRWSVASRSLAAVIGGYAVVALFTLALPLAFDGGGKGRPDALVGMMMASFLIWAAIIMAVFHARSAGRAWLWLSGALIPLAVVTWLLMPGAQP